MIYLDRVQTEQIDPETKLRFKKLCTDSINKKLSPILVEFYFSGKNMSGV